MRNRGRRRNAGRGLSSVGGKALGRFDILTITDSGGGTALVTTAAPHGLSDAASVTVAGTTTYDGPWAVAVDEGTGASGFILVGSTFTVGTTGGTWAPA